MPTNIFGWNDSRDVAALALTDYTEDRAMADIRRFAADYSTLVAGLTGDLAASGTLAKSKYGLGVGGEMQPIAEAGEIEAARKPATWDVAYPIYRFQDRSLYTQEYLATVTLGELEKDVIRAAVSDAATMLKMMLRALMRKTNFDFDDGTDARAFPKSGLGTLAVKRLCNADSAAGEVWVDGSQVTIAALQHYFGSNTASMTIAAFNSAYAKLKAVGCVEDVVFRISSSDEATVRGFTEFKAAQNPRIINPTGSYALVSSPRAIGRLEGASISGEVVVQPFMPSSYFFANDRAGGEEKRPLYIREHPQAQFQGFRLTQDETRAAYGDNALRNKRWERIAGCGVRNRVNGVCCQIVNSTTTYTDPSTI